MRLILLLCLCILQCLCSVLPVGNGGYFLLRSFLTGSFVDSDFVIAEIAVNLAVFTGIVLFLKCDIIYMLRNLISNSDGGVSRNNFAMFAITCLFIAVSCFYRERFVESFNALLLLGAVSFFCGIFIALICKIGFFQLNKGKIKPINAVCFGLMQFWSLLPGASVLNTAVFSGFCCGFDEKLSCKYALSVLAFSCVSRVVFSACSFAFTGDSALSVDYAACIFVLSLFICLKTVEIWNSNFVRFFKYFALYNCISGFVFVLLGFLG